ncbi:molybdopterin-binding protein [Jannaschia sp. LMIT008]|uniref:molybdopterin-binding protein n=1 Tax=Jannaschia maritima TaxID=3032585 RepID=UPI002811948E|nr:molybdopterin-binding protein [Jannaschia sp. LMIT008]
MTFDAVVAVDWSATSGRTRPGRDTIWTAEANAAGLGPARHHPTRHAVTGWLIDRARRAVADGDRILVVLDVSFGWPRGAGQALTGADDPLALWDWIAERLTDRDDGTNDRFALAGRMNAVLPGDGPFWGRPATMDVPGLPTGKPRGRFPPWRAAEDAMIAAGGAAGRPKSVWQLAYSGAVGSQTITAMAALSRLRGALGADCAVWPFQPPDAPVVVAEVYLAHVDPVERAFRDGGPKDAGQVRAMAAGLRRLGAERDILAMPDHPDAATEGWVLGIGFEDALPDAARAAARPPGDCFALPPGVDWVPVDVLMRTLSAIRCAVGEGDAGVADAAGRVLARDVAALRANPPRANAAVDGWGFAHATLRPGPIPVTPTRAAAGHDGDPVPPGHAARILTGAALPPGVDTVAMQEDATAADGTITLTKTPRPGANTRAAGEDVAVGDPLLAAGTILRPTDLAAAVAAGHATLPVRDRLRVAVLSTGDEIVAPGTPGHGIFDANRPMLLAMVAAWGMAPVDLGQVADDPDALAAALNGAGADAIVTSGGASAGDADHLAAVLGARGTVDHWRIAVKPGRPMALGRWNGAPLFGLPGNPVAAFTCMALFARPALLAMAGAGWRPHGGRIVPAAFAKAKKAGRREYLRARLDGQGAAEVFASEGSGRVSGLAWADGFVELPDEAVTVRPGDPVRYVSFAALGLG